MTPLDKRHVMLALSRAEWLAIELIMQETNATRNEVLAMLVSGGLREDGKYLPRPDREGNRFCTHEELRLTDEYAMGGGYVCRICGAGFALRTKADISVGLETEDRLF